MWTSFNNDALIHTTSKTHNSRENTEGLQRVTLTNHPYGYRWSKTNIWKRKRAVRILKRVTKHRKCCSKQSKKENRLVLDSFMSVLWSLRGFSRFLRATLPILKNLVNFLEVTIKNISESQQILRTKSPKRILDSA